MARLVAQWRRSGESQARFARRHQIPTWTLWYWCRKLSAKTDAATGDPAPTFVPVQVQPDGGPPVIEVVLRGGERVRIAAGVSPALAQAVVTTLRSGC